MANKRLVKFRPKPSSAKGDFVILKGNNLDLPVRPLRVVEPGAWIVATPQGSDGATISQEVAQLAYCLVPVAHFGVYLREYVRMDAFQWKICGSRRSRAPTLLRDVYNKGFHTFCREEPLYEVPVSSWRCATHNVNLVTWQIGHKHCGWVCVNAWRSRESHLVIHWHTELTCYQCMVCW